MMHFSPLLPQKLKRKERSSDGTFPVERLHDTLLKLSSMLRKAEFCISFKASAHDGRGQGRSGSSVTVSI